MHFKSARSNWKKLLKRVDWCKTGWRKWCCKSTRSHRSQLIVNQPLLEVAINSARIHLMALSRARLTAHLKIQVVILQLVLLPQVSSTTHHSSSTFDATALRLLSQATVCSPQRIIIAKRKKLAHNWTAIHILQSKLIIN